MGNGGPLEQMAVAESLAGWGPGIHLKMCNLDHTCWYCDRHMKGGEERSQKQYRYICKPCKDAEPTTEE